MGLQEPAERAEHGPHRLTSFINLPSIHPVPLHFTHFGRVMGRLTFLVCGTPPPRPSACLSRPLLQIVILIVMKYAAGCSDHGKQMKGALLFFKYLSIWYFFGFGTLCCSYSSTCLWYSVNMNALPGLLLLKPKAKGFPPNLHERRPARRDGRPDFGWVTPSLPVFQLNPSVAGSPSNSYKTVYFNGQFNIKSNLWIDLNRLQLAFRFKCKFQTYNIVVTWCYVLIASQMRATVLIFRPVTTKISAAY